MVTIKFWSESQTFNELPNQIPTVYLLMTSLTVLANKGLFELTLHLSFIRAVSLSFAETTQEPGGTQELSQLKKPFIGVGRRRSHEQGNGRDKIQVSLAADFKTW